jgi:glycosyltransferase involved in cell wall biosynthesis
VTARPSGHRPGPVSPSETSRPLRLLAVSPSGGRGGAETMFLRAVEAAVRAGWSVRCLAPDGPLADQVRRAGARVDPFPTLRLLAAPRPVAAAVLAASAARAAAALARVGRDADVVLVNGLLVLPALRLVPRRAARVWWAHDVLVRGDRLRLAGLFARSADLAVAVSDAVAAPLRPTGVEVRVVRNGVDTVALRAAPGDGPPLVGCVAALTPWKGQHVLLEAVARLGRADVQVELLGVAQPKDAPYEAALRSRADEPDLRGRVRFLGHVEDPLRLMSRWRAGVSASTDPEASGLGVLEGLSIGLPQIATARGGPAEVLGDGGLLVEPGDPDAMAVALAVLLDDDERWQRCARSGPEIAERLAQRSGQEAALLSVLEQAGAGRGRA